MVDIADIIDQILIVGSSPVIEITCCLRKNTKHTYEGNWKPIYEREKTQSAENLNLKNTIVDVLNLRFQYNYRESCKTANMEEIPVDSPIIRNEIIPPNDRDFRSD